MLRAFASASLRQPLLSPKEKANLERMWLARFYLEYSEKGASEASA